MMMTIHTDKYRQTYRETDRQKDRQTDHATRSIAIARIASDAKSPRMCWSAKRTLTM